MFNCFFRCIFVITFQLVRTQIELRIGVPNKQKIVFSVSFFVKNLNNLELTNTLHKAKCSDCGGGVCIAPDICRCPQLYTRLIEKDGDVIKKVSYFLTI